jgi:RNA polymerase sigma factor (sigma-70 family)
MATAQLGVFLRRLTRGMVAETLVNESDRQLIEQFLARRDEAVFETLVRRHGAMVHRVCWRVLQQEQDAEDAFQATFLILAQKLRTVRKHDSLASWLHGVAHRVALKAKARAAIRRCHERQANASQPVPPDDVTERELCTVMDTELTQLPEKWRLPLILCYLEGRTQEESASQLGWSKKTLRRRLEEARDALGSRLKGRGIVWSAALSSVLLSDCVASSAPAANVIASTVAAAAGVAAGNTVAMAASAKVAALAEGVMNAMFLSKMTTALIVIVTVVGLGTGVGLMTGVSGNTVEAQEEKGKSTPNEPAKLRVHELIQQLNANEFQKREQATKELKALGKAIVPQLEAALEASESAEVRRRLEQLLAPYQQIRSAIWFVTKVDDAAGIISVELQPNSVGHALAGVHVGFTPGRGIPPPGVHPELFGVAEPLEVAVRFGDTREVAVAKGAAVVIDGREGKLTGVKKGMQVSFLMAKDRPTATRVEATTPGRATLKGINIEKKTITATVRGEDWSVPVAAHATLVVLGKKGARLADLKPGMGVTVQLGVEAGAGPVVRSIKSTE